jgi:hypothetical protein
MRVWIAVWTGSSAITRVICNWIRGGPAPRLIGLALAAGFIKGLPWTTSIAVLLAVGWLFTAITVGLRLPTPTIAPAQPKTSEQGEASADETASEASTDVREGAAGAAREPFRETVIEALHGLLHDTGGVHLQDLAQALPGGPWKTGQVRSLLASHGIRVRPGVRVPGVGGREGVHRADIPPLPSPAEDTTPAAVVAAGQSNNNNGNNGEPAEEQGEDIVQDAANPNRWHVLPRRARPAARTGGKGTA